MSISRWLALKVEIGNLFLYKDTGHQCFSQEVVCHVWKWNAWVAGKGACCEVYH